MESSCNSPTIHHNSRQTCEREVRNNIPLSSANILNISLYTYKVYNFGTVAFLTFSYHNGGNVNILLQQ